MTTPASAPPYLFPVPLESTGTADPNAIVVNYYDCTNQTLNLTLLTALGSQHWDYIRKYCQEQNTRTLRFERVLPPMGALFAVYYNPIVDAEDKIMYNIQWYGHKNKVVATVAPNDRIWETCHTLFKNYCLENTLYNQFDKLPSYSDIRSYVRSIVSNNTMKVPLYPEKVKANTEVLDKLNTIFQYMGMTPDQFKDRVMRGFSATSGISIEGSTDEKKTYVASYYHEQLTRALEHVTDTLTPIEHQNDQALIAVAWTAFKNMLEAEAKTEPLNAPFDDDLLHRIQDVLEHEKLPEQNKNYIALFKRNHKPRFKYWDNLFVNPAIAPFKYSLKPMSILTQETFLNNFGVSYDDTVQPSAGGGRGVEKRMSKQRLSKIIDGTLAELRKDEYGLDKQMYNNTRVSLKALLKLYDNDTNAQTVIETARNQLEQILNTETTRYNVQDPRKLPENLVRAIQAVTHGINTLS
jgi:hypothetical protein